MCLYGANLSLKIHAALLIIVQQPVSVLSRLFRDISKMEEKHGDIKKNTV